MPQGLPIASNRSYRKQVKARLDLNQSKYVSQHGSTRTFATITPKYDDVNIDDGILGHNQKGVFEEIKVIKKAVDL